MELSVGDRMELHELAARYGNTIDERNWDRFDDIFTEDCRYELANMGRLNKVVHGKAAVRQMMEDSQDHPLAHHITNVEVVVEGERVTMRSKNVAHLPGGLIASADYFDEVVRTPEGWRIADRYVTMRRPPRTQ